MRFQTTLEAVECLRRSDAGWQSVPGTRRSDKERAVTNRRTTRRWCDKGRRRRRSQPLSCIHVRPRWQVGLSHPQGAQTWITQFNLQTTPCLPLAFVRVQQTAPPRTVVTRSSCSLLLIYRPRKDERLSWPSWLTYSGRFTHISGHLSAVDQAQDIESSPVKDQRSAAEPRNQLSQLARHRST